MTQMAIDHYARQYPRCRIVMREFLGGRDSLCGFVPNDHNGVTVDVGDPWAHQRTEIQNG